MLHSIDCSCDSCLPGSEFHAQAMEAMALDPRNQESARPVSFCADLQNPKKGDTFMVRIDALSPFIQLCITGTKPSMYEHMQDIYASGRSYSLEQWRAKVNAGHILNIEDK